jgi:hypothetical protein
LFTLITFGVNFHDSAFIGISLICADAATFDVNPGVDDDNCDPGCGFC